MYVRLFQRRFKWIHEEKINYDHLAEDLKPNLNELLDKGFIVDENEIDSYEEIMYLLKTPQLKELAKECNVLNPSQTTKIRHEFIRLILDHFGRQKSLKFFLKDKEISNSQNGIAVKASTTHFMKLSKQKLGRVYKLQKEMRSVFVRILMLYALSSTHNNDPTKDKDSGQETL